MQLARSVYTECANESLPTSVSIHIYCTSSQQDMFLSSLFALGFLVGVISEGGWAIGWWKWQEFIDDLEDETSRDLVDALNLYFDRIFGAMCISAVSTIIIVESKTVMFY